MMIQNRRTSLMVVMAAVFAIGLLGLVIPLVMSQLAQETEKNPQKTAGHPAVSLLETIDLKGIWAQSPGMAAGWADRYHFYPSGAFHFYPNQMTCPDKWVEKAGAWQLNDSVLSLTVTHTITRTLETNTEGFCTVSDSRDKVLSEPVLELYAVKDLGFSEASPYPGISLNGVMYWQYSQDASQYGEEQFPE